MRFVRVARFWGVIMDERFKARHMRVAGGQRGQPEDLLRRERAFLQQIIDISPNLIFVKDRQGRFILANKAVADVYGVAPDAIVGKTDADLNSNADEVESFRRIDLEVMDTLRERLIPEERITDSTGRLRWLQTVKRPILDADGKANQVLGTAVDITNRKTIEEALKQSQERFLQVGQVAGEFIWEVDSGGMYTYASPVVEKLLGYRPEELVGKKHFYDVFAESTRDELKAAVFRLFADRQPFRNLLKSNISKDGTVVRLESSGVPVLDAAGNLVGYRGADFDVTGRVRSEQEIAQQRNELAHLSRVSMLSELSGSLAHELNQPLAAILSNAQAALRLLAHDGRYLGEAREILHDIVTDDKRAGEVIQGLRVLLKKGEAQYGPLDLNDVVQDVVRLVRSQMLNAGVRLTVALAPDLPKVVGARVQLQQVILNLVVNGCDALAGVSPKDRQLDVRTETARDGFVRVCVTDRGSGILPQDLDHVFDAFFTTKVQGLGLGLSVCQRIVSAHGGRLWAANNTECGASFYFTLPVARRGTE